ncbi:COMM domain-containing protein 4-like [Sycon ciliatum]|uniref:COMM domain-containing protein 4-like n=1 Tax=Sycon ciliatum TaxID=27933 RepID=UPI0031F67596
MRFRFCGDLDCPDWVLAEISILSRITSIKMKLLCIQVIQDLLGKAIDYEKVFKLTGDAKYEPSDVKASIAALHFIISNAGKYAVASEVLSSELQQLGLPKEHSSALCRAYGDNLTKLQDHFAAISLRLGSLKQLDWRVDYILSSSQISEVQEPSVQLQMKVKAAESNSEENVAFSMSSDKFRVFLSELKQAYAIVENLAA